jgi:hypothetical protein
MRRWILTALASGALTACNPFFFLPAFKEGPERVVPTKPEWISRGKNVAGCLQDWAHHYFADRASNHFNDSLSRVDYSDVTFADLTVAFVGGDGVIGIGPHGETYQAAGAERADTILFNEATSESSGQFIATMRHEDVHIVQQTHHELIGANGDIHWPPPFDYCKIPRVVFVN